MNWTNEKPSKPGLWLYRETPESEREAVYVDEHGPSYRMCSLGVDVAHGEQMPGQWAGPIPEPTDDKCGTCGGEGGIDSGGTTPWGSGINIPCPSCSPQPHYIDPAVKLDLNEGLK